MSDSQSGTGSSAKFQPGDDYVTYFRNVFNILTKRMPDEEIEKFRVARDLRNEEADCKRCDEQKEFLLNYSPIIRFMRDSINQLGGNISSNNIHCRRCTTRKAGGFDPKFGILICANEMRGQGHLEDTMAHEMVHAYDHLRFKVDWGDNLRHAACTEIRASSLSGECRWANEFFGNLQLKLTQHHQECVRRRAILSVKARDTCKDEAQATKVVDEVWDSCFRDTRPFDEIFR
ncbi:mitochondrial inner membrane protease atp23 [Aspergillus venezuelensis]